MKRREAEILMNINWKSLVGTTGIVRDACLAARARERTVDESKYAPRKHQISLLLNTTKCYIGFCTQRHNNGRQNKTKTSAVDIDTGEFVEYSSTVL